MRRGELIQLRISAEEKAQWKQAAEAEGLDLSSWIRRRVISGWATDAVQKNETVGITPPPVISPAISPGIKRRPQIW